MPTQETEMNNSDGGDGDAYKAFLSRIPSCFTNETLQMLLEKKFGEGTISEINIISGKDNDDDGTHRDNETRSDQTGIKEEQEHKGFGFVTFNSTDVKEEAISIGSVRGRAKSTSKRKYTIYIGPVVRNNQSFDNNGNSCDGTDQKLICFQWLKFRCQYGNDCKFLHEGKGGCIDNNQQKRCRVADDESYHDTEISKKRKKGHCFSFKKKGKCKLGDDCPFFHEKKLDTPTIKTTEFITDKSLKDCISWKTKGKCRKKGTTCPYRHDEAVQTKALEKKKNKNKTTTTTTDETTKKRQPLSIRVFGLNYETTENDIRQFFADCGPIRELTFPIFEDSGRSKGFCGVLFQSPKAVEKAVALNGSELHGRWLSIQEGKMYLRQWEDNLKKNNVGGSGDGDNNKCHGDEDEEMSQPKVGEFGQKVKKRKKHGFKDVISDLHK